VEDDLKSDAERLDVRRRRLVFRCWHRGTREMDLLLGRYVDAHVADMTDPEVKALEHLLEAPDPEIFAWIAESKPIPPNYDTPMLQAIRTFHEDNPSAKAL
jgi:antitoxin CptB